MSYLTGALFDIGETLEELQKKEILGVKVITAQEEETTDLARYTRWSCSVTYKYSN